MKILQIIFCAFLLVALCNCKQPRVAGNKKPDTLNQVKRINTIIAPVKKDTSINAPLTIIELGQQFTVKARSEYGDGKNKTYIYMELWHNNLKLFTDTSHEYVFTENPYPMINNLKPEVFELQIEYDNRPSKNLVTFLRIDHDKIVKKYELPSFDTKPETINGQLTYHGIWDYGEVWDENGKRYTTYNPKIYYKFTPDGLKLDTVLTILKNKQKYGRFEGFEYKSTIGYPSNDRGNITDTATKNILRKPADY